jgi:hypothetical protein
VDNYEAFPILAGLVIVIYKAVRKKIPGFYLRYINSAKWRRRSRMCRRLAGGRCQTVNCRNAAYHAHHKDYRFLASWTPIEIFDLVALCRSCHAGLHRVEGGRLRRAPGVKRNIILRKTTDDWVSGKIGQKEIAA